MNIRVFRPNNWWYWIVGIFLLTSGVTTGALGFLMQLPQFNCHSESPDTASARIYCANNIVDERNPEKLLQAIQLVHPIPESNPLHSNSNKLVTRWSQMIIELSEQSFQQGNLSQAIDLAQKLPDDLIIQQQVSAKIQEWQSIWSDAEDIYRSAESTMKADESKNWYTAITQSQKLKSIKNQYWATTKYQELIHSIQAVKEAKEKTDNNHQNINNIAKEISPDKDLVPTDQEKEDFFQLQKARRLAKSGKVNDLRNALMEASLVISDSHYQDARILIKNLETQIAVSEDTLYLAEAKRLAAKKDEFSLEMAINEAGLISKQRPLYNEANQHIELWKKQRQKINNSPKVSVKLPVSQNIERKVNQSVVTIPETQDIFSLPSKTSKQELETNGFKLEELENQLIQQKQKE
jgi:hypothetical protein